MFWFTFPYRMDGSINKSFSSSINRLKTYNYSGTSTPKKMDAVGPRYILLVDDSLSILKVISRLLVLNGHTVETAANGSIGLSMLKKAYTINKFDIVITDLQMPVMVISIILAFSSIFQLFPLVY